MWTPKSAPSVKLLPSLLEKMPILLFAGDRDAMCPGVGIEAVIDKLEWAGATGFNGTPKEEWTVEGRLAGSWQTDRGLTYVEVFDASHSKCPLSRCARSQPLAHCRIDLQWCPSTSPSLHTTWSSASWASTHYTPPATQPSSRAG